MTVLITVAGAILAVAALLALWRVIRGPSIVDRVIGSDVLLTTLILVVGVEMVANGHTRTIPLMVVLAATAILGTVSVARFVTRPEATSVRGATSTPDGSGFSSRRAASAKPDSADRELDS